MCAQEKGSLVMELGESAMLVTRKNSKTQANQKGKGNIPPQVDIKKESKCLFFVKRNDT